MRSPAAAIAWEFRRRHRWGLAALILYFAILATVRLLVLEPGYRLTFEERWMIGLVGGLPLTSTIAYLVAVFSFGLSGDLAARQSLYPARMFTLPVTNAALAGWPMLYGTVSMAVLWLVTRLLALWPDGVDVPWIWPALFAAVFLAWTQALTWMPYAFRGLRVIVVILWLSPIGFVIVLALHLKVPEPLMLALLAPQLPLAFLVARSAVARARHGDTPDWRDVSKWIGWIGRPRRRARFPSPAHAQVWFEWQQHGRSLPGLMGILLPFELSLLFLFRDTPVLVAETLGGVLITPPFMAAFVAATVRKSSPRGSDSCELTSFIARRPLTNAALISAKLKATVLSTLATWLLLLAAMSLALWLSGTSPVVVDGAHRLTELVGTPRAVGIGLLGITVLVLATWKQLVQSLYIGLSGRPWLVKTSVFVTLSLFAIVVPFLPWVVRNIAWALAVLWNSLPWILALLVCVKVCAAASIAWRLRDRRLVSDSTLVIGALSWDASVVALYGLLVWLLPTLLFHSFLLALVAILAIPLARLSAAPLALSWNRHR